MTLAHQLASLRLNQHFMPHVVAWQRLPARRASFARVPDLPTPLEQALHRTGIAHLYTHQAAAYKAAQRGEHVVTATSTASGKSLCYHLPVLASLVRSSRATSLYLFPTKALAHDQHHAMSRLLASAELPAVVHTYDGDTPSGQRSQIRRTASVIVSNPDMLHAGILPYHLRWRDFFRNLRYVVVDEIHTYRGVFGTHVAHVLRRLRRLCNFYGSDPQFICSSATIANPREHAELLTGLPFTLIDHHQDGSPAAEKHFILYNPPIIDEDLGLRQSLTLAARDAAYTFLEDDIQTAVFARARNTVELLLTYLQDDMLVLGHAPDQVRGYRGGYLPLERREIERGLRQGEIRGVVATNALELGVDIGELEAVVIAGYPGSIAATWQQAGRAGRRTPKEGPQAAVILVAGNSALDQYLCRHPAYLFGQSPEHALINPDNTRILVSHLQCAAFELPLQRGEKYGGMELDDLLLSLQEAGFLHRAREQFHYLGEEVPAHTISLRTSGQDRVVIHDITDSQPVVVGEVDLESAPYMVYEGAIYMHQARPYQVLSLDWEGRLAQVHPVDVDYYTRASMSTTITRLSPSVQLEEAGIEHAHGEVTVMTQASGYRKIRRYTHETLGYGAIDLPEMLLETSGYWLIIGDAVAKRLVRDGILLMANDYGPHWPEQRQLALDRDGNRCRTCGAAARPGKGLHVHHVRPFRDYLREWVSISGASQRPGNNLPDTFYQRANHLDNLVTLCSGCHRRAEASQQTRSALGGFAYALRNLAPLFLMCDPADIAVSAEIQNPLTRAPTLVMYEQIAAGVGFSQRLFESRHTLLRAALELVSGCDCRDGCPACVGPPGEIGPDTKVMTRVLLKELVQGLPPAADVEENGKHPELPQSRDWNDPDSI